MVEAAARASVLAWLATPAASEWEQWLAYAFAKTVRRARPVEVDRAKEWFVSTVQVGDAEAFGCVPT